MENWEQQVELGTKTKGTKEKAFLGLIHDSASIGFSRMIQMIKAHWYHVLIDNGMSKKLAAIGSGLMPATVIITDDLSSMVTQKPGRVEPIRKDTAENYDKEPMGIVQTVYLSDHQKDLFDNMEPPKMYNSFPDRTYKHAIEVEFRPATTGINRLKRMYYEANQNEYKKAYKECEKIGSSFVLVNSGAIVEHVPINNVPQKVEEIKLRQSKTEKSANSN